MVKAAESLDYRVLGFGIQPFTPKSMDILTPRKRYEAMNKVLGDPWLWFTVTASDQVHVDIAEPELLRVINVRGNFKARRVVACRCLRLCVLRSVAVPAVST